MIRKLEKNDREQILRILTDTKHFNDDEIKVAMELIDIYLNDANQKDYIIYVSADDDAKKEVNSLSFPAKSGHGGEAGLPAAGSGRVSGYICYGLRPLTDWTYDLYWIAVDPDIHGKGLGSGLVKHMEEDLKARSGRIALIETSGKAEYENERKFYSKNGYEVQTIIKDFYRSGDDLFVYRKYL